MTRLSLTVSGLVDRDLEEVNLSDSSSVTVLDSRGSGAFLFSPVNWLSLTVLPGPIP